MCKSHNKWIRAAWERNNIVIDEVVQAMMDVGRELEFIDNNIRLEEEESNKITDEVVQAMMDIGRELEFIDNNIRLEEDVLKLD